MKRYQLWLWPVVWFLLGGGWWWATRQAVAQFAGYRSPLQHLVHRELAPPPPPVLTPPLTERVVLVVLSGVGAQTLNDPANPWAFRTLRRLAAEGAWGISTAVVPSGDAPTWAALLTGATPALSGVVLDGQRGPAPETNALDQAAQSTLLIGSTGALSNRRTFMPQATVVAAPSSDRVAEAAAKALRTQRTGLAVVVLDLARREQYSGSPLWERVDAQLADVVGVLDPQRDTLVVTSDHGVLGDGKYGGSEPQVTQTPLVLWGRGISLGPVGVVRQIDIAPTMAMLRGTPIPIPNQGHPIIDAPTLSVADQAQAVVDLLGQRAYLARLQQPKKETLPLETTLQLQHALVAGDWASTRIQAQQLLARLDAPTPTSPLFGSEYVWYIGVPLVLFALSRLLGRTGRRLVRWLALPVLGVEIYLLVFGIIFFGLADRSISLSAIYGNLNGTLLSVGGWAVLALVVAMLPLAWLAVDYGARTAVRDVVRLVVLLQVIGAVVAGGLWLSIGNAIAQATAWTALVLIGAQLAAVGLAAPFVAAFAAALTDVLERGR